jgi:ASC-1-like (ASCH) protein
MTPELSVPSIVSPNTVLANALLRSIDLIRPKVKQLKPSKIEFVVGTQINGAPHLGTNLVQTIAFLLARLARRRFSIDTRVRFVALDNAPYDIDLDPETHHAYQLTYYHALGADGVSDVVDKHYRAFFESLSDATDAEYEIETYTAQQSERSFRLEFIRSLRSVEEIRWWLAPSHGVFHVRIPCPQCGWSEKRSERTELIEVADDFAAFRAVCLKHGDYELRVEPSNNTYLDLNTLYRNLVKERATLHDDSCMPVMVKGGDWAFGCQLVDGALSGLGSLDARLPMRVFTPQILSATGAKLSKSLIRAKGATTTSEEVPAWMLDTSVWPHGGVDNYVDSLIWLAEGFLADPKHFFRSYTTQEISEIMKSKPTFADGSRVRGIAIYKRYFDLIASGEKTIEVRVAYSSMKRITAGQLLRFECRDEECLTRVRRVANYRSFDEMFDHEDPKRVNPHASRDEQLAEIRKIFPAQKEALGVIAIEVERV